MVFAIHGNKLYGLALYLQRIEKLDTFSDRDIRRDIPKIIKFKATNSLRVSCLFCIFKHSPQKTV